MIDYLKRHALIGVHKQMWWSYADAGGVATHVEFMPRVVVAEPSIAQGLIASGVGIGRLPDYIAAGAVARGEWVRLLADLAPEHVELFAVAPRPKFMSAKVRVFIDALAQHMSAR